MPDSYTCHKLASVAWKMFFKNCRRYQVAWTLWRCPPQMNISSHWGFFSPVGFKIREGTFSATPCRGDSADQGSGGEKNFTPITMVLFQPLALVLWWEDTAKSLCKIQPFGTQVPLGVALLKVTKFTSELYLSLPGWELQGGIHRWMIWGSFISCYINDYEHLL